MAVHRIAGRLLLGLGVTAIVCSALVTARAEWVQREQKQILAWRRTAPGANADSARQPQPGGALGLLDIPRLHVSVMVLEGDEPTTLLTGVGHASDTPLPWHDGNSVLAAHRDTFFRPLKDVRIGDHIRFATADIDYDYVVRDTRIVASTDVRVMAPTMRPTLTLITCYPFNYIGRAPQRFVVRAERIRSSEAVVGSAR